ncbi:hypothetical protein [Labilibaculum antarcticum]|uniref:Uncharacterized protein n=1 Tax=Labilibaculum antarcticum TaxID=1717717 RepID=A0A1Y1CR25_9BACT|nr:hypothetical protein [Labilibaculum antarcticum]BAX81701.1 hypothetical protein ALGA_3403 [Labilibaculum antarcticum]
MTDTLISLLSIIIGIIGANSSSLFFKKYSFGLIGNTIAGVFGSVFFIKSIGRLGFSPQAIMQTGSVNFNLFVINSVVSFCGGLVALILLSKLATKFNKSDKIN